MEHLVHDVIWFPCRFSFRLSFPLLNLRHLSDSSTILAVLVPSQITRKSQPARIFNYDEAKIGIAALPVVVNPLCLAAES